MEWLRKLLEGAKKKDDGNIDIDDLMKSINTEFPKNAVPKTTYNEVSEQLKTANATIKDRDKQIEGLKKVDAEALQGEITKLQDQNKLDAKKYQDELKDVKLTNAIKLAIAGKVHDEDMAASLFDKTNLILTDEGKVAGLDEQLKSIQDTKSFLFKTNKVDTHYDPSSGGEYKGSNPFAKETFNLTKQGELLNSNPAQAKELAAAAGVTLNI